MPSKLKALGALGQSVWLDDLRRDWLADGRLAQLIAEDGISGVTTNPAIMERAISSGGAYLPDIERLASAHRSAASIYEELTIADVQQAADILRGVHVASHGRDGFVSLEVSPYLANNPDATVREAHRLWTAVARQNLMIKIPGTRRGLIAVSELIAAGINVNVTLLFSMERYCEAIDAYASGLEQRIENGKPVTDIIAVASFFVSRIDAMVDGILARSHERQIDVDLRGRAGIACAVLAYQEYLESIERPRWRRLGDDGAVPLRLLWASTGTKDPEYPPTKYVDALIGPDTISTVPVETLEAYRVSGDPAPRLQNSFPAAQRVFMELAASGIDLHRMAVDLEAEGIQKFIAPFDKLITWLEERAVLTLGGARHA